MPRRPLWAIVLLVAGLGSLLAWWPPGHEDTTPGADAWRRHVMEPPFVLFRSLAPDGDNGRMVIMSLSPQATRVVAPLSCTRLHYAGGRGVCVAPESGEDATAHVAYVFDHRLGPDTRIELPGVPIRLRVAPTGRVAAITTLTQDRDDDDRRVTNSIIVDLASGALVADLRDFTIDHAADRAADREGASPIGGRIAVSSVAFERWHPIFRDARHERRARAAGWIHCGRPFDRAPARCRERSPVTRRTQPGRQEAGRGPRPLAACRHRSGDLEGA